MIDCRQSISVGRILDCLYPGRAKLPLYLHLTANERSDADDGTPKNIASLVLAGALASRQQRPGAM